MPVTQDIPVKQAVLNALERAGEPLSPKEMADFGEAKYSSLRSAANRMAKSGDLIKKRTGVYELPSRHTDATEARQREAVRTVHPAQICTERSADPSAGQLQKAMTAQTKLTIYTDVRPEAGDGTVIFEEGSKIEFEMPTLLLERLLGFRPPRVMGAMLCRGDSMKPIFEEDDPLLYRPSQDIDSDGNYAFFLDERLRAKRIELIPGGGYRLISANTRDGYGHYRLIPEKGEAPGNENADTGNGHLVNSETEHRVGFQPVGKILWPRRDTGRLHIDQVADLLHAVVQQKS